MGHRWANIKEKKTAKDANNSRVYTKFGIEIYVAAKLGDPDPHINQKLRFVIERAKTYNIPKHTIDHAIEKAKGSANKQYSELCYEGLGPNDSVVIVDALTNNVNRTAADVRATSGKSGGSMGVSGTVSYMFDNTGIISFAGDGANEILEYLMEKDTDARDVVEEDDQTIIYTEPEDFHHAREVSKERGIEEFTVTELEMVLQNKVALEGDDLGNFEKVLGVLEDLGDVQKVHHNVDLSEWSICSFI